GRIKFNRMDTHRRAVESADEAFFLRITGEGDYLYEGADMGILVMRDRLMTNDFKLTDRARRWIDAIRASYRAEAPSNHQAIANQIRDAAEFKMM
ncbi:MAG: biotin carboxylase, partial [Candidatus Krumholzibacteria bacterium]|nr:biotin carboxylase [Candidatus Krumholzibacteria bacterium]